MKKVLRLDEILIEKHIQQNNLASRLGVSKVSVSYFCNDRALHSLEIQRQIEKKQKDS